MEKIKEDVKWLNLKGFLPLFLVIHDQTIFLNDILKLHQKFK